jgi:DNA-directed RNA polymerase subunit RPC12/RpoP
MAVLVRCAGCGAEFRGSGRHRGQETRCTKCGQPVVVDGPTIPDFDVFISYSSADKPVADAVCAALEAKRWRCWIAPRDIVAGSDWGGAIIAAIEQSRVMVLVYSSRANQSQQVIREVERAVSKGLPIIPFRLEAVPLSKSMEYFLSASHWLDAMSEPLESHLAQLCRVIRTLLTPVPETGGAAPPTIALPAAATATAPTSDGEAAVVPPRRRMVRWPLAAGAVALATLAVAIALARGSWWHKDRSAQLRPSTQVIPASGPATQVAAAAGTTAPAPISQRTVLLKRTGFLLKAGRRIEHFEITIPPLATPTATLQILVENMGDDSGDMGMYCVLLDAKGTTVFRQFGRTDRLFTHEVGPLTSWTVVLQDQDTGRGGNGGSIEIAVAPR